MHSSCLDTEEYARYENPPRTGRGSLFSRQESQTREPLLAGNQWIGHLIISLNLYLQSTLTLRTPHYYRHPAISETV